MIRRFAIILLSRVFFYSLREKHVKSSRFSHNITEMKKVCLLTGSNLIRQRTSGTISIFKYKKSYFTETKDIDNYYKVSTQILKKNPGE